jgi:hypothetical protein
MKVWLIIYSHKHGVDHAVCTDEGGAWSIASSFVFESVVTDDRYDGSQPELVAQCKTQNADPEDVLERDKAVVEAYLAVERDTFNGENIEVEELPLYSTAGFEAKELAQGTVL